MARVESGQINDPALAARAACRNGHPWTERTTRWRVRVDKGERTATRDCLVCKRESENRRRRQTTVRAGTTSTDVLSQAPNTALATLFPGLTPGLDLDRLACPPHVRTALRRANITHGRHLRRLTPTTLVQIFGIGPRTLQDLLTTLALLGRPQGSQLREAVVTKPPEPARAARRPRRPTRTSSGRD